MCCIVNETVVSRIQFNNNKYENDDATFRIRRITINVLDRFWNEACAASSERGSSREKRLSWERSWSHVTRRLSSVALRSQFPNSRDYPTRVPYLGGSAVPSHGGINFSSTRDVPQRLRGNSVQRSLPVNSSPGACKTYLNSYDVGGACFFPY